MILFGNKPFRLKEDFEIYSDLKEKTLRQDIKSTIIDAANEVLNTDLIPLTATQYMNFAETGSRAAYDVNFHGRRNKLMALVMACFYEKKEEYLRKMLDYVWAICEESTWVIPAHNVSLNDEYHGKILTDTFETHVEVDLFSAATGAMLSMIYKYYGEDLDKLTDGVMTRRISYEVERRIIKPFSEREVRLSYISLNNWVSWICSNVMTIAANMIDFEPKRLQIVTRCLSYIDRLVYTYGEDGGCNEGANYWTAAICPLYDACEMLYDMTNGKINVYDSEFLKKACHFIVDMCIDEKKQMFYNFADGGVVIKIDGDEIYRMGVNLKDDAILTLADAIRPNKKGDGFKPYINYFYPYNAIKNLYVYPTVEYTKKSSDGDVYKDLQVSTYKTKDFSIAIKGGHNRESHNHNDVGSFMVYKKDQPIFIDVGPMEYTKDTFNDNRYTIWVNQSSYHNIPDICGNMQSPGRDFFAKSFVRDGNTTTVEYADAYLNKADISRCERKLKVNDSAIEIEDHVDVNGDVTFRFMTKFEPKLDGNKVQIDDVKVTFDGAQKIDVETINLTSNRLKLAWDTDKLYRISIVSHNLKTTIEA